MKLNLGAALLAGGLVLALTGGLLIWRNLPNGPAPAGQVPRVMETSDAVALPDFKLRGPRGEFRNSDLIGHWTFMFFGYTQCPDICPTALALMKDIKAIAVSPAPTFNVVFVSVDPRRDSNELLRDYLAAFDAAFIGVSGSDEALRPLTNALKVDYRRHDEKDSRTYTVDHGAAIHLIDPKGRPVAVFPPPQQAAVLAAEFARLAVR